MQRGWGRGAGEAPGNLLVRTRADWVANSILYRKSAPTCTFPPCAAISRRWGGQLEVIARFPDGAVKISNFAEIGTDAS